MIRAANDRKAGKANIKKEGLIKMLPAIAEIVKAAKTTNLSQAAEVIPPAAANAAGQAINKKTIAPVASLAFPSEKIKTITEATKAAAKTAADKRNDGSVNRDSL